MLCLGTVDFSSRAANADTTAGRPSEREQELFSHLESLIQRYDAMVGRPPASWNQVESRLGAGIWAHPHDRELITRRFAFIGISGQVLQSNKSERVEGELVLTSIYPISDSESDGAGRFFTLWKAYGKISRRRLSEDELKRFSKWRTMDRLLKSIRTEVARKPVLREQNTSERTLTEKASTAVADGARERLDEETIASNARRDVAQVGSRFRVSLCWAAVIVFLTTALLVHARFRKRP